MLIIKRDSKIHATLLKKLIHIIVNLDENYEGMDERIKMRLINHVKIMVWTIYIILIIECYKNMLHHAQIMV